MKLETYFKKHQSEKVLSTKLDELDRLCATLYAHSCDDQAIEQFDTSNSDADLFDSLMDMADSVFDVLADIGQDEDQFLAYFADKMDFLHVQARMNLNVYLCANQMEKILSEPYMNKGAAICH